MKFDLKVVLILLSMTASTIAYVHAQFESQDSADEVHTNLKEKQKEDHELLVKINERTFRMAEKMNIEEP